MKTTLNVSGMTCDGCERSVMNAVRLVEGVSEVSADHTAGTVAVQATDDVTRDALVNAIEDAGYDVLPDSATQLPMA